MNGKYEASIQNLLNADRDIRELMKDEINNGSDRFRLSCLQFAQLGIWQAITSLDEIKEGLTE